MVLLGREDKLGIGREERGDAVDPPQEVKKRERALLIPKEEASLILSWIDLLMESHEDRGTYGSSFGEQGKEKEPMISAGRAGKIERLTDLLGESRKGRGNC